MAWKFNDEPAAVFGSLSEVLRQVLPVLILFGVVNWTKEQLVGVMVLVSVTLTFLTILFTRKASIPTFRADSQIRTAVNMPVGTTVKEVVAEEYKTSNAEVVADPPEQQGGGG